MMAQRAAFSLQDALAVRTLASRETRLGKQVKAALDIIDEAVKRYGDSLALSFNGGKDCTVLVHLFATAICAANKGAYERESVSHQSVPPAASNGLNGSTSSSSSAEAGPSSSAAKTSSSSPTTNGSNLSTSPPSSPSKRSVSKHSTLPCIYVQCQSPFPQVETFVEESKSRYDLDLWTISAPMKEALQQYKKKHLQATRRAIEAVLVGTRFGDPYSSNLKPFQMTDAGWPSMMRVHPILDWSYDDIWAFLRSEELGKGGVGWCKLYDYGYTSLGSTFNTIPNPLLRDPSHPNGWKAAWELEDASAERAGRPAGPIPADVAKTLDVHTHGNNQDKTS